ncbi:MAG: dihydrodipicolinate synthase family protein [Planctomycetaceae bacterium]
MIRFGVETASGRVPVIAGVAETNTSAAVRYVRDIAELGAAGIMLMPPMCYRGDARESTHYLHLVAREGDCRGDGV